MATKHKESTKTERRVTARRVFAWIRGLITIVVLVFWFLFLRPQGLGGPASYALVSGKSMNPLYHTGDIVIVHKHAGYKRGDIIAYKVPKGSVGAGAEVIHRIIGGDGTKGFVVQGDNRTAPDIWHPKTSDVVGSAWLHIPKAGGAIRLLHTPFVLAGIAALVAILAVAFHRSPKPDEEETELEAAVAAKPAEPKKDKVKKPKLEPVTGPEPVAVPETRRPRRFRRDRAAELELHRLQQREAAVAHALEAAEQRATEIRIDAERAAEAILVEARLEARRIVGSAEVDRARALGEMGAARDVLASAMEAIDRLRAASSEDTASPPAADGGGLGYPGDSAEGTADSRPQLRSIAPKGVRD